jgi:hypothetical protein
VVPSSRIIKNVTIRVLSSPRVIGDLIFTLSIFFTIRFWINLHCLYQFPVFSQNVPVESYAPWFLTNVPAYPGKWANEIGSVILQWCADPFFGPLVVTALILLITLAAGGILQRLQLRHVGILRFVPGAAILLQLAFVTNPFPVSAALLAGCSFGLAYTGVRGFNLLFRMILFVLAGAIVYSIAVKGFLVFSIVCLASELLTKRNWYGAAGIAFAAVILPPVMVAFCYPVYPGTIAYKFLYEPWPHHWKFPEFQPVAVWYLSMTMVIIASLDRVVGMIKRTVRRRPGWLRPGIVSAALRGVAAIGFIAIIFSIVMVLNRDAYRSIQPLARMNAAMLDRDWDGVLAAGKIPFRYLTPSSVHLVDRALYYKGRLLDDLFTIPQNEVSLRLNPFIPSTSGRPDHLWEFILGGPTWFDLGYVNIAEHCALEAVSQNYYPAGLALLAKIYLVKEMPDAARACLLALAKDRGYRTWARSYLDSTEGCSNGVATPELQAVRAAALKNGFILPYNVSLAALLKENPANRMTFEYFIATNLVGRNLDTLVRYAGLLQGLGYGKIPRLYEEALLLGGAFSPDKAEVDGYQLTHETAAAFTRFSNILNDKHGGRAGEALDELTGEFGESFFFYYIYGFSKAIIINTK